MNKLFEDRAKKYFGFKYEEFINKLSEQCTQGFFLNTKKADEINIIDLIDFEYSESELTNSSYYHDCDGIGKTKAYQLGLIYPQEIAASISSTLIDFKDIKTVVDMCSAPGGKSINFINKLPDDALFICNDVNHLRSKILSSNLERLGLSNVIITNKKCDDLSKELNNYADLVILDAPCSGEGMIRKYPEILDEYSLENIIELSKIQESLLENAYTMLRNNGILIYSTCTYAFEEDENQIINFLNKHNDIEIIPIKDKYESTLDGTIKLSPLNNTEGQFICIMQKKNNEDNRCNVKYLKPIKEKLVDDFIKENIDVVDYYLYKHNDHYYLSLVPLIDLRNNVIRYSVYVGDIVNKRFEPSHCLYRSNNLSKKFKYRYDLDDNEYEKFISGNELTINKDSHYYLVTYKGYSLGYGKCSNGQLKNKYPKGLRLN